MPLYFRPRLGPFVYSIRLTPRRTMLPRSRFAYPSYWLLGGWLFELGFWTIWAVVWLYALLITALGRAAIGGYHLARKHSTIHAELAATRAAIARTSKAMVSYLRPR